ncbi:MAG: MMPL family transporter [Verrucomicrobia bacterium]|nr:MMPL family transporter [Verrucomicrobiota bacterium]
MTFVPAFIMLFISQKSLHRLCRTAESEEACEVRPTWLTLFLRGIGKLTHRHYRAVIWASVAIMAFSVWGIMQIKVNDNPVKWFTRNHEIRVADNVLNNHFGGTYTAYLTFDADTGNLLTCREASSVIREQVEKRFKDTLPEETAEYVAFLEGLSERYCNVKTCNPKECLVELVNKAASLDEQAGRSWNNLADAVNYLEVDGLTFTSLVAQIEAVQDVKTEDRNKLTRALEQDKDMSGNELLDKALAICDEHIGLSFREFTFYMEAQISAPAFKRPEVLRYIEGLQQHLLEGGIVGKTSSAVDALKKASYELNFTEVPDHATDKERESITMKNDANFSIPDTPSAVGQVFIQLEGMKKKDTLFHLVTRDYREANIWVQLKSGDNQDMADVVADVKAYVAEHNPPVQMETQWAGLTYLNVVWQDKMVKGMMSSLVSSFVVVLVMMLVLFRSGLFGILAMIPLTVTIAFIYGLIGWAGKDYDMPVAILSAMTLGLSVDFAIHFLERSREIVKKVGSWDKASTAMFEEPAKAISRNAIVIALGFTPLLFAPLVPYRTVGLFLALIMLVSWLATLLILPSLVRALERKLFSSTQMQRVVEENEEGDN